MELYLLLWDKKIAYPLLIPLIWFEFYDILEDMTAIPIELGEAAADEMNSWLGCWFEPPQFLCKINQ